MEATFWSTAEVCEILGCTKDELETCHRRDCVPLPRLIGKSRVYVQADLDRLTDSLRRYRLRQTGEVCRALGIATWDITRMRQKGMDLPRERFGRWSVWADDEVAELRKWLKQHAK